MERVSGNVRTIIGVCKGITDSPSGLSRRWKCCDSKGARSRDNNCGSGRGSNGSSGSGRWSVVDGSGSRRHTSKLQYQ